MTIRSLSRFVLVGVLLASFNASAIPGFWQQGYGHPYRHGHPLIAKHLPAFTSPNTLYIPIRQPSPLAFLLTETYP